MRLLSSNVDGPQLMVMLTQALQQEARIWQPFFYEENIEKETGITGEQRDEVVRWLSRLMDTFHLYPETLALSVCILDRFLHVVKARPKYLRCIALSCFYLAAKTQEEDEIIPGTEELVQESECGFTVVDVLRMERIILDKLQWDVLSVTPLSFLHIFHALLMSKCPHLLDALRNMTPSRQLSVLTRKLERCQAYHHVLVYRPATVALALVSLELELFVPEWFRLSMALQKTIQVDNHELIHCREIISHYLSHYPRIHAVYIFNKRSKRKVDEIEDDVYDSIKRLYNEEETSFCSSSSLIAVVE